MDNFKLVNQKLILNVANVAPILNASLSSLINEKIGRQK